MRLSLLLLITGLAGCSEYSGHNPQLNLFVKPHGATVQDTAGEKGRILQTLPGGSRVTDLDQVSRAVAAIQFGENIIEAPWIKVGMADGTKGWIFAGSLQPEQGNPDDWLTHKKARCFFGETLTHQVDQWRSDQPHADQQTNLLDHYQKGMSLKANLTAALLRRASTGNPGYQPDFAWLNNIMPGFIFQRIGSGATPYLFADYRYWRRLALATSGETDDAFFDICVAEFPLDSIESFYPAWTIQTGDDSGSSQLGTGMHLKILKRIDPVFGRRDSILVPVFPAIKAVRDDILADILENKRTYWQPVDKIKIEINQILEANPACLAPADKLALKKRLEMFNSPAKYDIRVNMRSGL